MKKIQGDCVGIRLVLYPVLPWAPAENFVGGGEPQKGPPQDKKGPPPQKSVLYHRSWGLGGMLSRENFNSGAPYYILDASQQGRI